MTQLALGHGPRGGHARAWWYLLAFVALLLVAGGSARTASAVGEGFFSLDADSYQIQEGTALPVTILRTNGTTLEQDVNVTVQLSEGTADFDYPASTITQVVKFAKLSNVTSQTIYFQTINQQRMVDKQVRVTITQVSIPNAIAYPSTAPILLLGIGSPRVLDVVPKSANPFTDKGQWIDIYGVNFSNAADTCPPGALPNSAVIPPAPYAPLDGTGQPIPPSGPRCTVLVEFYAPSGAPPGPPVGYPGTGNIVPAGDWQVLSPSHIRAKVPTLPQILQPYNVRVTIRDPKAPPPLANGTANAPNVGTHYLSTSSVVPGGRFWFQQAGGPTINNLSARTGSVSGGGFVRIYGTNLTAAMCSTPGWVTFGGVPVAPGNCTYEPATLTLAVTTPPHSAGPVDVVVGPYPAGPPATNPLTPETTFTYAGGPTILSITPNSGPTAGGTTVIINGTGFAGVLCPGTGSSASVRFGATASAGCTVNSDTQITAISPLGTGTQQITVIHPANGTSPFTTAANFTYSAGPVISSVSPGGGTPGGGTLVTITGSNFADGATVTFGGIASASVMFISTTEIRAVTPAGAGTVNVVVTVAGVASLVTNASVFSYATPGITLIQPNAGPTAGGNIVTVKGFNFTSGLLVMFGNALVPPADVTFVDPTMFTVKVPKAVAGPVEVKVTTPSGTSPAVPGVTLYTYTDGPIVQGLNPKEGSTGGGTIVIITGVNFGIATAPVPQVLFGTTPAEAVNRNSETQITALSPAVAAPGPVDIIVTTGQGSSPVAPEDVYTYKSVPPTITGLSPDNGPVFGGTTVTLTGVGFLGVVCPDGVKFGTVKAASCTVNSDTSITAVSPPNVAGPTTVIVTSPNGQSEIIANFTYTTGNATPTPPGSPLPGVPPATGSPVSYSLNFRWTLFTWMGPEGIAVASALKGQPQGGPDITARVAGIFAWDAGQNVWLAYFPGTAGGPPRASDFSTFQRGRTYWIAINGKDPLVFGTIDQ
ncbi:MAG: IPT/TIG domain-containing protein [Chloroflexi bacterium]|nr:IPT/TIG domain-containing protein [Chloroflexota bacterium]